MKNSILLIAISMVMLGCQSLPNKISAELYWADEWSICVDAVNESQETIAVHQAGADSDWQPGVYVYVYPNTGASPKEGKPFVFDELWTPGYLVSDAVSGHRLDWESGQRLIYRFSALDLMRGLELSFDVQEVESYWLQVVFIPGQAAEIDGDAVFYSPPRLVSEGRAHEAIRNAFVVEE